MSDGSNYSYVMPTVGSNKNFQMFNITSKNYVNWINFTFLDTYDPGTSAQSPGGEFRIFVR